MPIELHIPEQEPPITKLKLGLVGKEKHGKSRLAATARRWVLVHDFDGRGASLKGLPGVAVITYVDPQWPMQPDAAQKFLDILAKLEQSLDLSKLGFPVPPNTLIATNVIDSVVTMGKAFQSYALSGSKDIRREIKFAGYTVHLPGGWDAWNAEMIPVENSILRLLALPTDTIVILHETAEEHPDSTSEKPKFTGRTGVFPVRYQRLLKYLDEVWRVKLTQSVDKNNKLAYLPKVYPQPTYEFDAATTLMLDSEEAPNIAQMLEKHTARFKTAHPELLPQLQGAKVSQITEVKSK